jgi:hypothetical protein
MTEKDTIASVSIHEVLPDGSLGPELLVNGDFSDASAWTKASGQPLLPIPELQSFYLMFDSYRNDWEAMGHNTEWWFKGRGPTRLEAVQALNQNIAEGITLSRTQPVIWSKARTDKVLRGKSPIQEQLAELEGLLDL